MEIELCFQDLEPFFDARRQPPHEKQGDRADRAEPSTAATQGGTLIPSPSVSAIHSLRRHRHIAPLSVDEVDPPAGLLEVGDGPLQAELGDLDLLLEHGKHQHFAFGERGRDLRGRGLERAEQGEHE